VSFNSQFTLVRFPALPGHDLTIPSLARPLDTTSNTSEGNQELSPSRNLESPNSRLIP
jgi:hypothetical protein